MQKYAIRELAMTRDRLTVAPGGWLGLLGGGQLGRMFAMAAQSLGYRVAVLDPARDGPAASVCDEHFEADYLDAPALENLALQCAAVTTEFENVPAQSLAFLAEHCFTTPSAESVAVAQDRIAEKSFIASCGIAVVPHAVIEQLGDFDDVNDDLFPAILKISRLGYDGKGQARVANRREAIEAFATLGGTAAVLEKRLDLAFEASVIVARGGDGATAVYAPAENMHRDGILAVSMVPSSQVTPTLETDLVAATLRIAHALDYVGVLCVEFFIVREAEGLRLFVNEIAPRPHNSGHYTIDACITSQFAQQARIAAGLPLGETRRHSAAVMLNLLGDLWFADEDDDELVEPDWVAVCKRPGANLHLYGKREARRGRKMGHVTIVADQPTEAKRIALEIADALGIEPW
jgi:5-(carboxyamino)imidazole ribonucleotide synthase